MQNTKIAQTKDSGFAHNPDSVEAATQRDRPRELQKRISNALAACNAMFANELGAPKRKRRAGE